MIIAHSSSQTSGTDLPDYWLHCLFYVKTITFQKIEEYIIFINSPIHFIQ